jgi:hypothetical protein
MLKRIGKKKTVQGLRTLEFRKGGKTKSRRNRRERKKFRNKIEKVFRIKRAGRNKRRRKKRRKLAVRITLSQQ